MNCPKCNKEFTGNFCPDCGFSAAATPDITKSPKPRKKNGCLVSILVVVGIFVLLAIIGSFASKDTSSTSVSIPASPGAESVSASQSPPTSQSAAEPKTIAHQQELTSGHFTAGIDFPGGKYDIMAVSGNGNVSSDNMFDGGINAMLGDEESNKSTGTSLYEQEYKNVKLPEGTVLSVSGVVINISSEAADTEPLKPRNQSLTETVELTSGNYISGEDFPEGTYDITAASGSGNVTSDNMFDGGLNAMMGDEASSKNFGGDLYTGSYRNVSLPKGTELKVNGLKISMTPSK